MVLRCWVLLLLAMQAGAQSRWTGSALNNLWADPANWEQAKVPGLQDDVLLDNSLSLTDYRVVLPDAAVRIRTLRIQPAASNAIVLELPITNLIASVSGSLDPRAFETSGNGYTIQIGAGGTFLNASGSSSGYSLRIKDSISILDGGRYIHRTRTGHAELVQQLSRQSGTETGVFRFENTDAASTISMSGRTFGTLQLSAVAAPSGKISYSSAGTNKAQIRGNLELEPGVTYSLHFDDTIQVNGNLLLDTALFNLSSGNRSSVILLKKDWIQKGGGINETNASGRTGTIMLAGDSMQSVSCTGLLSDSIMVSIGNPYGVSLAAPLRLSYVLDLVRGALYTGTESRLSLAPGATIRADSISRVSYIEGDLVLEGLQGGYSFLPLGSGGIQRWISLRGIHGDVSVMYQRESAFSIGEVLGAGIDHVSQLEYWVVRKIRGGQLPDADAVIELSFDDASSGGVSYLPDLRVAAFKYGIWSDMGNSATSGAAFDKGSVTSSVVAELGSLVTYFTLASAGAESNTLPVLFESIRVDKVFNSIYCYWRVADLADTETFELELSDNGRRFSGAGKIPASLNKTDYRLEIPFGWQSGFCRISGTDKNGKRFSSRVIRFSRHQSLAEGFQILKPVGADFILVNSPGNMAVIIEIFDAKGSLVARKPDFLHKGQNQLELQATNFPAGIYTIRISGPGKISGVQKLVF